MLRPPGSSPTTHSEVEDPLIYLPRKAVIEHPRGRVIYDQNQPANGIHLIVQGKVKVAVPSDDGTEIVIDIYSTDDFFGECGLLELSRRADRAVALDKTMLMSWTTAEIEEQIERQPRLGIAMLQMLVERAVDLEVRLETFALDKTPQRVARALLRFADRLGRRTEDGSVRIPPLTHQLISEYVGTSREIVTFHMNRLRQQGFMRYSRKGIELYADALRENLRQEAIGQRAMTGTGIG